MRGGFGLAQIVRTGAVLRKAGEQRLDVKFQKVSGTHLYSDRLEVGSATISGSYQPKDGTDLHNATRWLPILRPTTAAVRMLEPKQLRATNDAL